MGLFCSSFPYFLPSVCRTYLSSFLLVSHNDDDDDDAVYLSLLFLLVCRTYLSSFLIVSHNFEHKLLAPVAVGCAVVLSTMTASVRATEPCVCDVVLRRRKGSLWWTAELSTGEREGSRRRSTAQAQGFALAFSLVLVVQLLSRRSAGARRYGAGARRRTADLGCSRRWWQWRVFVDKIFMLSL